MDHSIGHTDKDVTMQLEKGKGRGKFSLRRVIMRRIINLTEDGRIDIINLRIEYFSNPPLQALSFKVLIRLPWY